MTKKLKAKTFRDAAERIASLRSHSCCFALDGVLPSIRDADEYAANIRSQLGVPEKLTFYWWSDKDCNAREARILALLLCAEMCDEPIDED